MLKIFGRKSLLTLSVSTALVMPSQVFAQEAEDGAVEDDGVIVVTARSREENIQKVPLAITAVTSDDIEKKSIENLGDVARFTAGFSFESLDGGNAAPTIRGQSSVNVTSREQTTATFFDGVYLPRSWLVNAGVDNLSRVEVVKGPQSSRFGRNAFSGAINFIPNKANADRTSVTAKATYGSFDRFDIGGNINIVGEDGILGFAASYYHTEFDGSWKNDHPFADAGISPGTDTRAGGYDNQSYSFGFFLKPSDAITIEAAYYGFERDEEAGAAEYLNTDLGDGNCGTVQLGNSRLFCGELPLTGNSVTVEPRSFGRQSDVDIVKASAAFELSDVLDFGYTFGLIKASTLTGISAEADPVGCGTILPSFLFPGPLLCNFQASPLGNVDYKSHEARLVYDDDALRLELGGFLLDGRDRSFFVSANLPALSPTNLEPLDITSTNSGPFQVFNAASVANLLLINEETDTDVKAIFGAIGYSFGDTRINAEARYTWEKIRTEDLGDGGVFRDTFRFFTPRVTIEHDLTDENLIYASAARGAKSGGFNSGAVGGTASEFATFDPEFNWTFEIGSKNTIFDGRGSVNIAAFYTDWKDQQVRSSDPNGVELTTAITQNLGSSRVWGLELEGAFDVTDNFSVDVSASYTDAKFKDGTRDVVFSRIGGPFVLPPCDDVVCSSTGDVGGNELPRAPKFQGALGLQYAADVSDDADIFIRADGTYQSRSFADTIEAAVIGDRFLVNGRAGINYKNFGLSVWARNLFDKKYVSNSTQIIQPRGGNLLSRFYGDRRTIGVTLTARFED